MSFTTFYLLFNYNNELVYLGAEEQDYHAGVEPQHQHNNGGYAAVDI